MASCHFLGLGPIGRVMSAEARHVVRQDLWACCLETTMKEAELELSVIATCLLVSRLH